MPGVKYCQGRNTPNNSPGDTARTVVGYNQGLSLLIPPLTRRTRPRAYLNYGTAESQYSPVRLVSHAGGLLRSPRLRGHTRVRCQRRRNRLDPFCGTGTTLLAATMSGRNAVGIEVNPFLCFASRVKTTHSVRSAPLEAGDKAPCWPTHTCGSTACVTTSSQQSAALLPEMPRMERWIARKVACKIVTLRDCIAEHVSEENRDIRCWRLPPSCAVRAI